MTLTECYAHFGITVSDPRKAWSRQGNDGTVVVTLWSDLFKDTDRNKYSNFDTFKPSGIERTENKNRMEHLKYARDKQAGIFQSIVVTPKDSSRTETVKREIGPPMRLTQLDEDTGEFSAERAG
jgi:hypothetical protein